MPPVPFSHARRAGDTRRNPAGITSSLPVEHEVQASREERKHGERESDAGPEKGTPLMVGAWSVRLHVADASIRCPVADAAVRRCVAAGHLLDLFRRHESKGAGMTDKYTATWTWPSPLPGPSKPSNDTGVYLRSHKHSWRRLGSKTWPSGAVCPTFECRCGSVICDLSVDLRALVADTEGATP